MSQRNQHLTHAMLRKPATTTPKQFQTTWCFGKGWQHALLRQAGLETFNQQPCSPGSCHLVGLAKALLFVKAAPILAKKCHAAISFSGLQTPWLFRRHSEAVFNFFFNGRRNQKRARQIELFHLFFIVNTVSAGVPTPPDSGKTPQLKTSRGRRVSLNTPRPAERHRAPVKKKRHRSGWNRGWNQAAIRAKRKRCCATIQGKDCRCGILPSAC